MQQSPVSGLTYPVFWLCDDYKLQAEADGPDSPNQGPDIGLRGEHMLRPICVWGSYGAALMPGCIGASESAYPNRGCHAMRGCLLVAAGLRFMLKFALPSNATLLDPGHRDTPDEIVLDGVLHLVGIEHAYGAVEWRSQGKRIRLAVLVE